jgi:hypothetical protein
VDFQPVLRRAATAGAFRADFQKHLPATADDLARRLNQPPARGLYLRTLPFLAERDAGSVRSEDAAKVLLKVELKARALCFGVSITLILYSQMGKTV